MNTSTGIITSIILLNYFECNGAISNPLLQDIDELHMKKYLQKYSGVIVSKICVIIII